MPDAPAQMRGTSRREDNVFWIIALDDMKKNADDKRGARFISHFNKPRRNTQHEVPPYEWHFVTASSGEVSISHKQAQTLDVFLRAIESGITKHDEIAEAMKVWPVTRSAAWRRKPRTKDGSLVPNGASIASPKKGGKGSNARFPVARVVASYCKMRAPNPCNLQ